MKTILENNYSYAQQLIIGLAASFFGYHLYQEIANPANSQLTLSILLLALTYFLINQYGTRPDVKK